MPEYRIPFYVALRLHGLTCQSFWAFLSLRVKEARGSKYLVFKGSGPRKHSGYGFRDKRPETFGTRTLGGA